MTSPEERERVVEEAAAWFARLRAGDPVDQAGFEAWYVADADHADAYDRMLRTWEQSDQADALTHLRARSKPPVAPWWALVAACLAISVGLTWFLSDHRSAPRDPLVALLIVAPPDGMRRFALADGSRIILDASGALDLAAFARDRRVDLKRGRARFMVSEASRRTFTVATTAGIVRAKWRNDRGLEAWGDFVLPPGYRPGTKLPMVIVQYTSRGFLRGGTNDDYPIYLLAARGFAVLSFERPPHASFLATGLTDPAAIRLANFKDWADRRSVQSSLERGVAAALATGTVDAARIGITGLSDGATSVRFALINSRLFAAAAISGCCIEPVTAMTLNGPRFADDNLKMGFPSPGEGNEAFWAPMSVALNARRIDTPLLMQVSDDEMLLALEAFEALRQRGKPVEMFVFPDEHHGKWQPVHRAAVYERSLDWFDFWLQGRVHSDARKRAQYVRWRALRTGGK